MTVNTGATIPAGIFSFILNFNCQYIFLAAWIQIRRQVVIKRCITIRVIAQQMTIQPNIRIHVHAIKMNGKKLYIICFCSGKFLSVPACSTYRKSCSGLPDTAFAEWTNDIVRGLIGQVFYAPVVWKIYYFPFRIIIACCICRYGAVFYKMPTCIKWYASFACVVLCIHC